MKAMQFDLSFRYTDMQSPAIQKFYYMLQAIALAEDKCDWNPELDDMLTPGKLLMSV